MYPLIEYVAVLPRYSVEPYPARPCAFATQGMLLPDTIHDSVRASYTYTRHGAEGSFETEGTTLDNCLYWI